MNKRILSIAILLLIIIAGVAYKVGTTGNFSLFGAGASGNNILGAKKAVTFKGAIESVKEGLFLDSEFTGLLKKKYNITIEYTKIGSLEMVQSDVSKYDFLFPAGETALVEFKNNNPVKAVKIQQIFNTPLVIYSWKAVTEALAKQAVVKNNGDVNTIDIKKFAEMTLSGRKWSDIGMGDLYGRCMVISTDPSKSSSGSAFAALLSIALNNGELPDETSIDTVLPTVSRYFKLSGFMDSSSGDLFEQYLKTGMGAKPMIVGQENLIIEFAIQNPDIWNQVNKDVKVLYPVPTIWMTHPLIILNKNAEILIQALEDKEIQDIAWRKHGFRTGLTGNMDVKSLAVKGIPATVTNIVQMPSAGTMDKMLKYLEQ